MPENVVWTVLFLAIGGEEVELFTNEKAAKKYACSWINEYLLGLPIGARDEVREYLRAQRWSDAIRVFNEEHPNCTIVVESRIPADEVDDFEVDDSPAGDDDDEEEDDD